MRKTDGNDEETADAVQLMYIKRENEGLARGYFDKNKQDLGCIFGLHRIYCGASAFE
jgi:hypothetical protein